MGPVHSAVSGANETCPPMVGDPLATPNFKHFKLPIFTGNCHIIAHCADNSITPPRGRCMCKVAPLRPVGTMRGILAFIFNLTVSR
jgi:hypothetical protein